MIVTTKECDICNGRSDDSHEFAYWAHLRSWSGRTYEVCTGCQRLLKTRTGVLKGKMIHTVPDPTSGGSLE